MNTEKEMALRAAQEILDRKKRQVAVYERLEQQLTKIELEEEEDDFKMGEIMDIIKENEKQIMITDANIFDQGPAMNCQDELDEIERKINDNEYDIGDTELDEPTMEKDDIFFATEIDTGGSKQQPNTQMAAPIDTS
jgi:hypothetical protein